MTADHLWMLAIFFWTFFWTIGFAIFVWYFSTKERK